LKSKIIFISVLLVVCCYLFSDEVIVDSTSTGKPKITMLELGSITCVPCKMMEPVLESIRENYESQIEVIFYDVKVEKEKAAEWKIRMIPTQVFLDENGKEIHRHVGFYPEEQIDEFLLKQGLVKSKKPGKE